MVSLGACACVPDFPNTLLFDPLVLQHAAVVDALQEVQRNLSTLYVNTTRDGLSFAVVCGVPRVPFRLILTHR